MLTRQGALDVPRAPVPEAHLIQYALATEAIMRSPATHFGEDAEMRDKVFAASVSRENIRQCSALNLELDAFLTVSIAAMAPLAEVLGAEKK